MSEPIYDPVPPAAAEPAAPPVLTEPATTLAAVPLAVPASQTPAELAPVSVAPISAWPAAAGYPPVWPPMEPPKAKWSKALWVFAPLVVVLLTGLGIAGVVYANNRAVAERVQTDQRNRIDELNQTVDKNARTLTDREAELARTREEVDKTAAESKNYEKCSTTSRQFMEASDARDTAKAQALISTLVTACQVAV